MPKFFVDRDNIRDDCLYIYGDSVNHIKNVFRQKVGDRIVVCDGVGNDYCVVISEESLDYIKADILSVSESLAEPRVNVTLYQGLPKGSKMEFIIQKNVELGIQKIIPVVCERTVVKLGNKDVMGKVNRWNRIAREAAKQSGRGIVPCVSEPVAIKDAIGMAKDSGLLLIPYEKEKDMKLKDILNGYTRDAKDTKDISVFIGPEGGFTEFEIDMAVSSGAIPVTLGNRILRTETASMYMTSVIMYELD